MDKEKFVREIVQDILNKDGLDDTYVTEVELDDNGNSLHVKFTGGVSLSTLVAIGEAFGDDDPNVYGQDGGTIYLVMINEKYDLRARNLNIN